jgi:hypothetical protein
MGKLVMVLEGGYDIQIVSECTVSVVKSLMGIYYGMLMICRIPFGATQVGKESGLEIDGWSCVCIN